MKLGPVTKLNKRNKTKLKKFDDYVMSANSDVIVIFRLTANLELFGSRIPDAWSIKLTFLLIVTFDLTKGENRTKKFLTFSDILQQNADVSIFGVLVLKGILSETRYVCVYLRTKLQGSSLILPSFRQGQFYSPLPPLQNEPLKSSLRLGLS